MFQYFVSNGFLVNIPLLQYIKKNFFAFDIIYITSKAAMNRNLPSLLMCGSRKYLYLPLTEGFLFCTHPPPPSGNSSLPSNISSKNLFPLGISNGLLWKESSYNNTCSGSTQIYSPLINPVISFVICHPFLPVYFLSFILYSPCYPQFLCTHFQIILCHLPPVIPPPSPPFIPSHLQTRIKFYPQFFPVYPQSFSNSHYSLRKSYEK